MGQSLADAAVRGTTSTDIADRKQSLLEAGDITGLLALEHSIFGNVKMMAKDDADDDADDEDDDEDDSDDDEDDSEDDEDDDDKGKGKKKPDPRDVRIQELSAEAKKKRIRIRTQSQRIADLEAENTRLKGKGKKKAEDDEDDADEAESEEAKTLKQENLALKERLQKQTIRQEFNDFLNQPKQKIKFKDPKVAFKLLDLDEVDVDEDGDVEGLEDAIKELAKDAPYLLVGKDDKDDEDDEDEPKRRTGQRSGSRSRKTGTPNREALIKKYGIKR